MSLLTAGGLDWMTAKDPFQPKAFHDSMKNIEGLAFKVDPDSPSFRVLERNF